LNAPDNRQEICRDAIGPCRLDAPSGLVRKLGAKLRFVSVNWRLGTVWDYGDTLSIALDS